MSLRKPTKPKYKAQPKAPRMTASPEAWKRYDAKVSEISKENLKRKAAYESAVKAYENAIKQREAIKAKARNAKAKL